MKKFYVSLTRDLLFCYLEFEAESTGDVRQHLGETYFQNGIWKLPWCSIYEDEIPEIDRDIAIIIPAQYSPIIHQKDY